jgi:hypothetical protein
VGGGRSVTGLQVGSRPPRRRPADTAWAWPAARRRDAAPNVDVVRNSTVRLPLTTAAWRSQTQSSRDRGIKAMPRAGLRSCPGRRRQDCPLSLRYCAAAEIYSDRCPKRTSAFPPCRLRRRRRSHRARWRPIVGDHCGERDRRFHRSRRNRSHCDGGSSGHGQLRCRNRWTKTSCGRSSGRTVPGFAESFTEERDLFFKAAAESDTHKRRDLIGTALSIVQQQARHSSGPLRFFATLEDLFLTVEVSAQ